MSPTLSRPFLGLGVLAAFGAFAANSTAQCTPGCSAQGNATLTVPARVLPGSALKFSLQGARSGMPAAIGLSAGAGPVCFSWGKICLSAPIEVVAGNTPLSIDTVLPPGTTPKSVVHFQGFVVDRGAPNGFLAMSASRSMTTLPGLSVYSDAGLFDTLGTFQGGGGVIKVAEIKSSAAPEGTKFQRASFTLPAGGGWAGLFIQIGPFNSSTTVDMSALAKTGKLQLMIRAKNEVEIGVRSQNIGPGQERSKLLLRKEGLAKLNGTWEFVRIPLSKFKALEPRLDFSKMKIMLGLAVTNGFVSGGPGTVDFDFVRWAD